MGYVPCDATVWGTGVLNQTQAANIKYMAIYRDFDVRAVRGPLTRRVLEACGYKVPEIYGNPAILMPDIYRPLNTSKKYDCSVVFHFRYARSLTDMHQISIETKDYVSFIDEIVASKKVISSSLHGIILSEIYGVPAVFLCENIQKEDIFKYYDWYYSTNRYNVRTATSLEEAVRMEPMELPKNIEELKEGLLKSFPYDLWENK